jgi:membrane protein DedA with SNARE-associated domain
LSVLTPVVQATRSARRLGDLARKHRSVLVWAAAARLVLGMLAVFLVPALYEKHFVWVVLLRPTKEVLLAAGFLLRQGDVALPSVLLASVPFVVFGVWLMYLLGIAYRRELRGARLPGIAGRVMPPDRIKRLSKALEGAGARVVFLGRLAVFPSSLMAAAAGASAMPPRSFLVADGLGAAASVAEVLAAGYLLGEAYESGQTWLTVVGALVLFGVLVLVGRRLSRQR